MIKVKNNILKAITALIILYLLAFIPTFWGSKPLVVISGSMEDTLKVGSLVYYENEKIDNFEVDDIVVFKRGKHIISHRIVNISEDGFTTKGDANNTNDFRKVTSDKVIGKAGEWCIPYYGYYVDYIYTHKHLLYIAIVLLFGDLIFEYYRERKNRENERETNN